MEYRLFKECILVWVFSDGIKLIRGIGYDGISFKGFLGRGRWLVLIIFFFGDGFLSNLRWWCSEFYGMGEYGVGLCGVLSIL